MKKVYLIAVILIIALPGCVNVRQAQKSRELARFSKLPFLPGMEKGKKSKPIRRCECSPWK